MHISLVVPNSYLPTTAHISSRITPTRGQSDTKSSGASVSISDQAYDLSKTATATEAPTNTSKLAELKNYLREVNFESISPDEMNQLAFKLYDSGQLSADQVAAFKGIEGDTLDPMDKFRKINVVDHFDMMYNVIATAARSDSSLNFGVSWRKESINTLNAVRSFATSDRESIL